MQAVGKLGQAALSVKWRTLARVLARGLEEIARKAPKTCAIRMSRETFPCLSQTGEGFLLTFDFPWICLENAPKHDASEPHANPQEPHTSTRSPEDPSAQALGQPSCPRTAS